MESLRSYSLHTVSYGHRCEACALIKELISQTCHTVRNNHSRDGGLSKCIPSDGRHAVRQLYRRKFGTTLECTPSNSRHAVWYGDLSESRAKKCAESNRRYTIWYGDGFKFQPAFCKLRVPYFCPRYVYVARCIRGRSAESMAIAEA